MGRVPFLHYQMISGEQIMLGSVG